MSSSQRYNHYFPFLTGLFVAMVLIAGITSTKFINFLGLHLEGWIFALSISYMLSGILTEVYGYKRFRIVIWTGLVSIVLMSLMIVIVWVLPWYGEWWYQDDYNHVLMLAPRIFFAMTISYAIGEFTNSYMIAKLKIHTKGQHLFLRLIWSTIIGQFFDTILFIGIAFGAVMDLNTVLIVSMATYMIKLCIEIICFPLMRYVINHLKLVEELDHFDHDTDFNPFVLDK